MPSKEGEIQFLPKRNSKQGFILAALGGVILGSSLGGSVILSRFTSHTSKPSPSSSPAEVLTPVPTIVSNSEATPTQTVIEQPVLPPLPGNIGQDFFDLTNQDRIQNGLKPLTLNSTLDQIARQRSIDVFQEGKLNHYIPGTDQLGFAVLLKKFNFPWEIAGENLQENNFLPYDQSLREANTELLNSPDHRANIMNTDYTEMGVGVTGPDPLNGAVFYVQIFAKEQSSKS